MKFWKIFFASSKVFLALSLIAVVTTIVPAIPTLFSQFSAYITGTGSTGSSGKVLGTATVALPVLKGLTFKAPVKFDNTVQFTKDLTIAGKTIFQQDVVISNHNLDLGTGTVTAANLNNLLNGVTAGAGIAATAGQTPTITNTGVLSFQGQTGAVTLTQGSGITISGMTITNGGVTSFNGQQGSVSFTAGTGLTVSGTTISQSLATNLVANGIAYSADGSTLTTLTPGTSGYILQSNGTGGAPSWVTALNLSGLLTDGFYAGANAILYAAPSTGQFTTATTTTGSQCLLSASGATGTPSWGACALGSNLWQENSGALSPMNIADDLLVGGASTASALFQIYGNAFNNGISIPAGTATTSGQLTFSGSSQINVLNGGTFAITDSVGGDGGNTTRFFINQSGSIGIKTNTPHGVLDVNGNFAVGNGYAGTINPPANGAIIKGTVGIGTATPVGQLQVLGASGTTSVASISGTTSFAGLVVDNSGVGDLFTASKSGSPQFVITNSGNVGVGTTTPIESLQVAGGNILLDNGQSLKFKDSGGTARVGLSWDSSDNFKLSNPITNGNLLFQLNNASNNTGTIQFNTKSTQRLVIDAKGNVGIGSNLTANPALGTLDVRSNIGTTPIATFSGATSFAGLVVDNSIGDLFTASSSGLNRFVITQGGNVGVGTKIPGGLLDVFQGTLTSRYSRNTTQYLQINTDNNYNGFFAVSTSGLGKRFNIASDANSTGLAFLTNSDGTTNTRMTIDNSGNVGINTTTPTAPLDVNGTASVSGQFELYGTPTIQSASNLNLTLGGATTGNIILSPLNSTGNVGINTATPGNTLSVNGTGLITGHGSFGSGSSVNQNDYFGNAVSATLNSQETLTSCANFCDGFAQLIKLNPTAAAITNTVYGINNVVGHLATSTKAVNGSSFAAYNQFYNSSTKADGSIYGTQSRAENRSTGSIATAYGLMGEVENSGNGVGNIGTAYGGYFHVMQSGTGTIGSGYGLYVAAANNSGTFTNNYGLYLEDQTGVGSNNSYMLYLASGSGALTTGTNKSYIGGVLSIGSNTNPTSKLFVANSGHSPLGKALVTFDQYENQDIFTASFSGAPRFVVTSGGNVGIGASASLPTDALDVFQASANTIQEMIQNTSNGANANTAMVLNNNAGKSLVMTQYAQGYSGTWSGISLAGSSRIRSLSTVGEFVLSTSNAIPMLFGTNDTEAMRITANGSIGIGTTFVGNGALILNQQNLSGNGDIFSASSAGTTVFNIDNSGNTRIAASLCVKATFTTACNNGFPTAGTIYSASADVTNADYAENYVSAKILEPGDLVMPANDGNSLSAVKTATQYQSQTIGIVSTNPGVILNSDAKTDAAHPNKYPIALAGRVPVKVNSSNGTIHVGDFLTASAVSGVAMKATKAGNIIGKALEDFTATDPSLVGKIMVFVNISWADPSLEIAADGNLSSRANVLGTTSVVSPTGTNLSALSQTPATSLPDYGLQIATLTSSLSDLSTQVASITAQMSKIGTIDDLTKRITLLEKTLSVSQIPLTSSSSSDLGAATENATVSGELSVIGKTLLTDLGVTGKINSGVLTINGMDDIGTASINTLAGPLRLQATGLNGLDILNGKIIVDSTGNMKVNSEITAKKYNVDTTDSASAAFGQSVISKGQTSITVTTTAVKDTSGIFTTPLGLLDVPLGIISQKPGQSFTIGISHALPEDLKFKWFIVN